VFFSFRMFFFLPSESNVLFRENSLRKMYLIVRSVFKQKLVVKSGKVTGQCHEIVRLESGPAFSNYRYEGNGILSNITRKN
jgi:hypothetical protein